MLFQDNHSTIVMEKDTVRKEFQEDLIVRKPNTTIYLLSLQIFNFNPTPPPPPPPPASDLGKNNRALWL